MGILSPVGNLEIPANVAPGSPATYEFVVDMFQQLQSANDASGLTAHGTSISDATTNQALVTVPWSAIESLGAGNVLELKAYGIISAPSSAGATMAFNGYSSGSSGTALATMTAFTPAASLSSALWEVYMRVAFWSATTVQCIVRAAVSSSTSTAAAAVYLAGNNSATPVTLVSDAGISVNGVMGSAVSGSSFECLDASWDQTA